MIKRKDIYELVDGEGHAAELYGRAMTAVILACLVPLCFKESCLAFDVLEYTCVTVFIVDYLMRWATADFKLKKGAVSFLIYPFTPMALIDLLTILPSFLALNPTFRALRVCRLLKAAQAFRIIRYAKGIKLVAAVFRKQGKPLLIVLGFTLVYMLLSAIVMFNIEPDSFETFLDALYWAVISITTIGYGDYIPTTDLGRLMTIISSLAGVAVIALPSGIITAGLLDELRSEKEAQQDTDTRKESS